MAKNFEKMGSINTIKEVAKMSLEKANIITVKMISDDNLIDYPQNHEDCLNTADLENSMRELGFTDPLEVTTFSMSDGKYMIVSGHRRRAAGRKVGIETFPCIVRTFSNPNDLRNYVLLSNSQRDSSKDPLLFCARYKMHEEYLRECGFTGSAREEIAKRLGLSPQQADRYHQFGKIILPIWDMVRSEEVGMSSVLGMATLSAEAQAEILEMLKGLLASGQKLTREACEDIIKSYRSGGKSSDEDSPSASFPFSTQNNNFSDNNNDDFEDDSENDSNDFREPIVTPTVQKSQNPPTYSMQKSDVLDGTVDANDDDTDPTKVELTDTEIDTCFEEFLLADRYNINKAEVNSVFTQADITAAEKVALLKKGYGNSGCSFEFISISSTGFVDCSPSKGMSLKLFDFNKTVIFTWNQVARKIDELIQKGKYIKHIIEEKPFQNGNVIPVADGKTDNESNLKEVAETAYDEEYLLTKAARKALLRTLPSLLETLKENVPNDYIVLRCLLHKLEAEVKNNA